MRGVDRRYTAGQLDMTPVQFTGISCQRRVQQQRHRHRHDSLSSVDRVHYVVMTSVRRFLHCCPVRLAAVNASLHVPIFTLEHLAHVPYRTVPVRVRCAQPAV